MNDKEEEEEEDEEEEDEQERRTRQPVVSMDVHQDVLEPMGTHPRVVADGGGDGGGGVGDSGLQDIGVILKGICYRN